VAISGGKQCEETMKHGHVHLHPGEYHASSRTSVITTILGSCVSACLFDPVSRIFGMNHFMLSSSHYTRNIPYHQTDAGRYGMHAMELLINRMLALGALRHRIQAKAFGGASILPRSGRAGQYLSVGEVNIRFIRDFLATEDIPLLSEDLGGDVGRIIRFHGNDFSVYVKKVQRLQSQDISRQERKFWEKTLARHNREKPDVTIWE